MSLAATFTANFDQFNAELAKAAALTRDFEVPVKNLGASLTNMARDFSGANIISQAEKMAAAVTAVGGATTLTDAEQKRVNATVTEAIQKYERLGQEVPGNLREIAAATKQADDSSKGWTLSAGAVASAIGNLVSTGVTALVSGIRENVGAVIELGGHLTDLSQKTGLSTAALQEMQYAGGQTGVSLDTMTGAVTKMGLKLAGGDGAATSAVKALGLSLSDLRGMAPEQAFYTLTDAVGEVQDPMAQAKLAADLFGKSGVELLPVINDAGGGFRAMGEQAEHLGVVMSGSAVAAADQLGDAWTTIKQQGTVLLAEVLAPFIPLIVTVANTMTEWARAAMPYVVAGINAVVEAFYMARAGINDFLANLLDGVAKIPILGKALGVTGETAGAFRAQADAARDALAAFNAKTDDAAAAVPKLKQPILDLSAAHDAGAKAAAKQGDELAKLAGADKIAAADQMLDGIKKYGLEAIVASQGIEKVNKTMADAIAVAPGLHVAADQFTAIAIQTMEANKALSTWVEGVPKGVGEVVESLKSLEHLPNPLDALMKKTVAELPKVLEGLPEGLIEVVGAAGDVAGPTFLQRMSAGFGGGAVAFGEGLGSTILKAVQGGGNVGEAAGAFVGQGVGKGLSSWASNATESIGGTLGGLLGSAASMVLPGVGGLIGAGFSKIMDSVFHGEEKRVNDMRDGFIDSAGGLDELNKAAAGAGVTLDHLLDAKKEKDFKAAQDELNAAFERHKAIVEQLGQALQTTLATGSTVTKDLAAQMGQLFKQDQLGGQSEATSQMFAFLQTSAQSVADGLNTSLKGAVIGSQEEFSRFGTIAVAAFDAAKTAGMTIPQAFAQIKPSIDALRDAASQFGYATTGGLDELSRLAGMSDQFGPLLSQIGGLGQALAGFGNMGLISPQSLETFTALTTQIGAGMQQMAAAGASVQDVLTLNQKPLQTMWELEEKFHVSADGATQSLIDQAVESGIVGEQFSNAQDRMVHAVAALIGRLDTAFQALGILPPAAATAADSIYGIQGAFDNINGWGAAIGVKGAMDYIGATTVYPRDEIAQFNNIDLSGLTDGELGDLQTALSEDTAQAAEDGAAAVTDSLADLIPEETFTAVDDLAETISYGIADACEDAVRWSNDDFGVMEENVADVGTAAEITGGQIGDELLAGAEQAQDAIYELSQNATDWLWDIEDAARGAAWGNSPTGVIAIANAALVADAALGQMGDAGVGVAGAIEGTMSQAARAVAGVAAAVGALGGGGGGGGGGTGGYSGSGSNPFGSLTDPTNNNFWSAITEQMSGQSYTVPASAYASKPDFAFQSTTGGFRMSGGVSDNNYWSPITEQMSGQSYTVPASAYAPHPDFAFESIMGYARPMAEGGYVKARPGGVLARLAEAGRDEIVTPVGGNRGGGPIEIHVHMHINDREFAHATADAFVDELPRALAARGYA